ncbi:hypothetical protein Kpho02_43360 [Kitasatospora phosalacinea]|uniref:Response regulatory domain-containing protein n=1 Tax=Kitasatospora phosalacinea TaxID=2065 RepID=A0A9W6Q8J6_9ACTN|nr:response regulator transcription factor [Kitasatospora phosalacinea]GLW72037.1 hypothetical protein Kpho02_43360 [Kitasatospora phosalacinea]
MTTVLIVDDQVLIRAGLAALVRAAPGLEVAGEAATGEEAVELAARHRPDVVLMDIRLPGISGIAALERILAEAAEPKPKVVMLTVFDLDSYVFAALKAGASGFLLKDTPPERLLAAVGMIAEGEMLFAPSVTRRLVETFGARAPAPRRRSTTTDRNRRPACARARPCRTTARRSAGRPVPPGTAAPYGRCAPRSDRCGPPPRAPGPSRSPSRSTGRCRAGPATPAPP